MFDFIAKAPKLTQNRAKRERIVRKYLPEPRCAQRHPVINAVVHPIAGGAREQVIHRHTVCAALEDVQLKG